MFDIRYLNRKTSGLLPLPIFFSWVLGVALALVFIAAAPVALAQPAANGITQPTSGETISGTVIVRGTATHPSYLRYELAFLRESDTEGGWIVFAEGDQPVIDGTLAVWNTTVGRTAGAPVFPDGRYQLRLRVVRTDYNYSEYFVTNLTIRNDGPTPTPTPDETEIAVTVPAEQAPPETTPVATGEFFQLTPLPTLTPFPTPTPRATPVEVASPVIPQTGNGGGLLGQLAALETSRLTDAFWLGAQATFWIFGCLAAYLLLRAIGRRLWRLVWARLRYKP